MLRINSGLSSLDKIKQQSEGQFGEYVVVCVQFDFQFNKYVGVCNYCDVQFGEYVAACAQRKF